MAAKIFQIIGVVVLAVATFLLAIILRVISRFLKKLNRSLGDRGRDIRRRVSTSISEMDQAQGQIEAFGAVTSSVKSGMESAIRAADRAVVFLKSGAFQVGFPVIFWFLLLVIAIPRGLRLRKRKASRVTPIPPPSWEPEEEQGAG